MLEKVRENRWTGTFAVFDSDKDGFISTDDLRRAFRYLNEDVPDDYVEHVIREADLDGNGKVDRKGGYYRIMGVTDERSVMMTQMGILTVMMTQMGMASWRAVTMTRINTHYMVR